MEDEKIQYPSKDGLKKAREEFKKQYRKEPPPALVDLINEAEAKKSRKPTPVRKNDIAAKSAKGRSRKELDT